MGNFGWRYGASLDTTAGSGVDKEVQFNTGSQLSGSPNFTFDYSNGNLFITGSVFNAGFTLASGFGNTSTINVAATIPANYNSVLYGPITIGTAGTLTIGNDAIVKIKDISDV